MCNLNAIGLSSVNCFGKRHASCCGICVSSAAPNTTMRVPILKQGDFIIASIQSALTDDDLVQLRDDLAAHVGRYRSKGVIVDVTVLDVMDSFATRTIRDLAQMVRLRGARTVIVGIQPEVAFAMVQLGLELGEVATALDLEEALALLQNDAK